MNMLFKKKVFPLLIAITWLACTLITATNAFAQQSPTTSTESSLKQVEIIVFSKVRSTALLSEQWDMPAKMPDLNHAIELVPFDETNNGNLLPQLLPSTDWKLNRISNRLSKSGYAIILHDAWVQDFSTEFNYPIHLFTPQQESTTLTTAMTGTITITLNRYYNVAINLLFGEPVANLTSTISNDALEKNFHNIANGVAYFDLTQNRRMKSDELNYIDHPLYGVLIKITTFNDTNSRISTP